MVPAMFVGLVGRRSTGTRGFLEHRILVPRRFFK